MQLLVGIPHVTQQLQFKSTVWLQTCRRPLYCRCGAVLKRTLPFQNAPDGIAMRRAPQCLFAISSGGTYEEARSIYSMMPVRLKMASANCSGW